MLEAFGACTPAFLHYASVAQEVPHYHSRNSESLVRDRPTLLPINNRITTSSQRSFNAFHPHRNVSLHAQTRDMQKCLESYDRNGARSKV